jgi:WD40 repeat protein
VAVALACGQPALLAEEGPEVVPLLLNAWGRQPTKEPAGMALRALRTPAAIDALCRQLIAMGAAADPLRQQLLLAPPHSATSPPLRQRLLADVIEQGRSDCVHADDWTDMVQLLSRTDDGEVLWKWALQTPPEHSRQLLQAIPDGATLPPDYFVCLFHPHLLQVVAEVATDGWPERVSPPLIGILKSAGFLPFASLQQRVAVALACGWSARLAEDGPTILPPLLEAWSLEATQAPARTALLALRTPATIDALCRHWIANGEAGDSLAALLLEAGHAPSDPAERALFWLLSGQLEAYDQLDGDGALLAQAQALASAPVRQRLAEASVAAGRTAWLQVVQRSQPLEAFSADDWAAMVQVEARTGDVETLWRWALQSPPLHARTLLRAIPDGAAPPPHLGEGARALLALAQGLPAPREWSAVHLDPCTHVLRGHGGEVHEIAWSPAGRGLASASADGTIRLWHPASGACNHILMGHGRRFHVGKRNSMAWSPDGRSLASAGRDGTICVWNTATGELSKIHPGLIQSRDPAFVSNYNLNQIAWSPDGHWIAANVADRAILVWDPIRDVCIQPPPRNLRWVEAMEWSPRGGGLAYVTGRGIRMWDPHTGNRNPILEGHTHQMASLRWSPDGSRLASCSFDYTIRLWDAASGGCTRKLLTEGTYPHTMEAPLIVTWSPDGRSLASASELGTIRLWDAASGTCTHTLKDLKGYNRSLAWSPNGRYLASRGGSEAIRLWNPLSGTCAHTLGGHGGYVWEMAWSPDGTCLASASKDGTIRLWRYPLEFKDALMTPLLDFDDQLWHFVSAFKTNTLPTAEWQWIRPWLAFIHALGQMIRRFDVDVEKTTPQQQESPFAVLLDG